MGNAATANGFDANTTAEQVSSKADLTGKWAVVTGCSDGMLQMIVIICNRYWI